MLNIEAARAHLSALFTDGEGINLRGFGDGRHDLPAADRVFSSVAETVAAAARAVQSGYGVFYGVNPRFPNSDGTADSVAECRSVWLDLDGPATEVLDAFPSPTIGVTTSPGKRQLVWRLKEPVDPDIQVTVNKRLARACGGDIRATDIARVLRLAGSLHRKSDPFAVTLDVCDPSRAVDISEIIELLDTFAPPEITPRTETVPASRSYGTSAIQHAAERVAKLSQGSRNSELVREAFMLGQIAAATSISDDEITAALLDAANTNGSIADDGDAKCRDTIRRGIAEGRTNPRSGTATNRLFRLTDIGNAERLVARYGDSIRYVGPWSKWLVWTGTHWAVDETLRIQAHAKETIRAASEQAKRDVADSAHDEAAAQDAAALSATGPVKTKKKTVPLVAWLHKSESAGRVTAMQSLAASEPGIAIHHSSLDCDPYLFNVRNGTIDLRTGKLRPHSRADLITRCAPVDYDPRAACPLWDSMLARVLPEPTVRTFVQRFIGLSLIGRVIEHGFAFFYGLGANGKSTILNTIQRILGEYSAAADVNMLIKSVNTRHPTELSDLHSRRFVVMQEAPQGQFFDESKVKALTGGDPIRARRMREDLWEFNPSHTLVIAGNHQPRIQGQDDGIWRRVWLVPFDVHIPPAEQDHALADKLYLPGVLRWAVDGCLAYIASGLRPPQVVAEATAAYRESQDSLIDFLRSDAVFVNPEVRANWRDVYKTYGRFCEENGDKPLGKHSLMAALKERRIRVIASNGKRVVVGIGLRAAPVDAE